MLSKSKRHDPGELRTTLVWGPGHSDGGGCFMQGGGVGWKACVSRDSFQRNLGDCGPFALVQGHAVNAQVPPAGVGVPAHQQLWPPDLPRASREGVLCENRRRVLHVSPGTRAQPEADDLGAHHSLASFPSWEGGASPSRCQRRPVICLDAGLSISVGPDPSLQPRKPAWTWTPQP